MHKLWDKIIGDIKRAPLWVWIGLGLTLILIYFAWQQSQNGGGGMGSPIDSSGGGGSSGGDGGLPLPPIPSIPGDGGLQVPSATAADTGSAPNAFSHRTFVDAAADLQSSAAFAMQARAAVDTVMARWQAARGQGTMPTIGAQVTSRFQGLPQLSPGWQPPSQLYDSHPGPVSWRFRAAGRTTGGGQQSGMF